MGNNDRCPFCDIVCANRTQRSVSFLYKPLHVQCQGLYRQLSYSMSLGASFPLAATIFCAWYQKRARSHVSGTRSAHSRTDLRAIPWNYTNWLGRHSSGRLRGYASILHPLMCSLLFSCLLRAKHEPHLDGRRHEEELLFEAQLFAVVRGIIWVPALATWAAAPKGHE
jgi:hypothetical protein